MLFGPVAQLARASALHAEGQGFESPRVHHNELVAINGRFFHWWCVLKKVQSLFGALQKLT